MASVVGIANRALSRIGAERIVSLTQANKAARAVNDAWEDVRDEVFRSHSWNSIATRAELPKISTDPIFGYLFQYQWPTDCMRVIEVLDQDGERPSEEPWAVEGRVILTDGVTPLPIRYVRREEDPNQYDSLLLSALAARLAVEIVEELTQSNSKKQLAQAEWQDIMRRARSADGQEGSVNPFVEDSWVTSRR